MLMVEDDMEQQYLALRFDEWSRAGVTRLWSGFLLTRLVIFKTTLIFAKVGRLGFIRTISEAERPVRTLISWKLPAVERRRAKMC